MITDSYEKDGKPILMLNAIYGEGKHLADVCMVTFSKVIFDTVLEAYDCEKISQIGACNGNIPIYALCFKGRRIAFYLSPIGSALASECIAEASHLIGAKKFVMFGSAGSLDREKTEGRFVIPTEAYRDEGMSYHYAPPSDYIKIKNSGAVREIFSVLGVPFTEGKTWTTDAILRETVSQMSKRKSEGCVAVEMEIAGVQSVCDFYGLDLYPFLVTGDVLSETSYSLGSLADANHNVNKFALALEIAIVITKGAF